MATQKTQKPPAAEPVAVITVTAVTAISYDGVPVAPGEKFDVRHADVDQLLAVKAITVEAQA